MKLKIISTGPHIGQTKVVNAETGEMVHGVQSVYFYADVEKGMEVIIRLADGEFVFEATDFEFLEGLHSTVPSTQLVTEEKFG